MEWKWKFVFIYPLPAFLTPLLLIPFTTEEITGCTNEASTGVDKIPKKLPSCCFISCFTVSVTPLINRTESSNDFLMLMIPFISSFEIK